MKFAICNEMFRGWPHGKVADAIAAAGYQGVELAPFTLGEFPDKLPPDTRASLRREFESRGLGVTRLPWLLAGPGKYSITTDDAALFAHTREYLKALVGLCRDLGGQVMVFGSPKQRSISPEQDAGAVRARVIALFKELSPVAQAAGVTICFEPLTPEETNFINTMPEGVALVEEVGHPGFRLHLDVKAMRGGDRRPPAEVIRVEGGRYLRYFHANDPNLLGPGMGNEDFGPIAEALRAVRYDGWVSVETFVEGPGPEEIARKSMETLRRHFGGG